MDTVRHKTTLSLRLNFHYNWNIWNKGGDWNMEEIAFELRPFLNEQGQLISLPAKNKKKLLAIWYLAERIPARRTFTEAEINDAIDDQTTFRDHATLRRELYNHHLLDRTNDGKTYWKEETELTLPEFLAKYC
mgnify:CR=1 FL=1